MICRLIRFQALFPTCLFIILAALSWHEEIDAASLQLTWADNSQNEDGFDIERKTGTTGAFLAHPLGVLNTKTLANGSHQLKVRATYVDKCIAERTVAVTVSNT